MAAKIKKLRLVLLIILCFIIRNLLLSYDKQAMSVYIIGAVYLCNNLNGADISTAGLPPAYGATDSTIHCEP